jgi:CheY-like chemotaxis protein
VNPCRILIVDDDPWIVEIIGELLREEGYIPILAASGEEALRLVFQNPPDLILLDLKLPGLGGEEVIRELRQAKLEIPIVLLTAAVYPSPLGTPPNVAAYLAKPFDLTDLLALVERFCPGPTFAPVG